MSQLRIGSCSWKYPSWEGLVYSTAQGINYLEEYSRRYTTVEIDQWFWSLFRDNKVKLPFEKDVLEYRSSVPEDFRFTVKVPNSVTLTHYYKKRQSDPLIENPFFLSKDIWRRFQASIEPLTDVMGFLIFQFEYLNKEKMGSQASLLTKLERFFKDIDAPGRLALEVRNPVYLNEGYFDFLNKWGVAPVLLHGYWMPPVSKVYYKWREKIIKGQAVILRLHGPNRSDIEKRTGKRWDKIVAPKDDELEGIAELVKDLMDHRVNVFLNVNNHYEGSAPLTIDRLRQLLKVLGVSTT